MPITVIGGLAHEPLGCHRKVVLHWGELGTRWGISRTVAQIHALLFLSPRPLNAEEIASTLGVARSNVSTSIRELESWGIIHAVHVLGDRREHYESLKDVSEMFVRIMELRKRRELAPTLQLLRKSLAQLEREPTYDYTRERLQEISADAESERAVLDSRLQDLARKLEELTSRSGV